MELSRDDWVKTASGEIGWIVHVNRPKVFVVLAKEGFGDRIEVFPVSQLTKIDPPATDKI